MRSQLIGQNCPNNEASEVGRNSEKKQNQKQKQQQKQKQKQKKNGGRGSGTGRNCPKSDGDDQNWTVASKTGRKVGSLK